MKAYTVVLLMGLQFFQENRSASAFIAPLPVLRMSGTPQLKCMPCSISCIGRSVLAQSSAEARTRRSVKQHNSALNMNLFDIVDAMNPFASRSDMLKKFFHKCYDIVDTDKSNSLDQRELSMAIEKLAKGVGGIAEIPFSEKQVTDTWVSMCGFLDSNHDGKLEFDEAWGIFVKVCGGDLLLEGELRLMPIQVYLAASTTAILFETLA
mmetsp:Transcript_262/g.393  ORF Transcript_262/g.393 Transcript_262/m.393 type:complete len:208 (-) Transcript_262:107-730(-)